MMIIKAVIYLATLLFITSTAISCQNTNTNPTKKQDNYYEQSLQKFKKFERNHGAFTLTQNGKIHYYRVGDTKLPTILWLHGTFGSSYDFMEASQELSAQGYGSLCIDYYGHGQTNRPDSAKSVYHMADDIDQILEVEKIATVVLIGVSRGGTIATAYYDEYSEKVDALVLVDGGSVMWTSEVQKLSEEQARNKLGDFTARKVESFASQASAFSHFKTGDAQQDWKLFNTIKRRPAGDTSAWSINYGISEWLWEANTSQILDGAFRPSQVPLFESSNVLLQPEVVYRNLSVPLLIIDPIMEGDWLMDFEEQNRQLADAHSNFIEHLMYRDVGHNVLLLEPERLLADVAKFLARLE
ncbi:alpha/beta fold hydrolase [Neolewinella antarctica]|uniref:Pimeloyl-ACP methyl ester carboxylesterase n=1 Tax=Neolewinella antarctica TaxID=442734 RepID=A0ABX0X9H2_9BACT|nr:alpha/beta hydrolase [Neolewinella antarctica]NJC25609.1 pimeloyl-ACP methyl ester carboxylesterase [Neolewinella antarctica]